MKIAVVGAGAMGGALAAEASLHGHDVWVVDVSAELVDHVNAHGLEIHSGAEVATGHPKATSSAADVGIVDVIVLFVKAQHTRAAAASLPPLIGPDTVVVSLQNGWGNADVLAEVLGADRLVFGVTYHSCSLLGLGVVNHSGRGETFIGSFGGPAEATPTEATPADALTAKAAQALTSSGWPATVTPSVRTEIWKKLTLNAATLPTAALTGLTIGGLGASAAMTPLVDGLARETVAVARALGLDLDPEERVGRIRAILGGGSTGKGSMLQDTQARRTTEIEVINAAVVRAGQATGTPTPLNEIMTALIAGLEESWQQ